MNILDILHRIASERPGLTVLIDQDDPQNPAMVSLWDEPSFLDYYSQDCIFDNCPEPEKIYLLNYFLRDDPRNPQPMWEVSSELSKLLSKDGHLTPALAEAAVHRAIENHCYQLYLSYLCLMPNGEDLAIRLLDEIDEDMRDGLFLACYRINTPRIFEKLHSCFLTWSQDPYWGGGSGEEWAMEKLIARWKETGYQTDRRLYQFLEELAEWKAKQPVSNLPRRKTAKMGPQRQG